MNPFMALHHLAIDLGILASAAILVIEVMFRRHGSTGNAATSVKP